MSNEIPSEIVISSYILVLIIYQTIVFLCLLKIRITCDFLFVNRYKINLHVWLPVQMLRHVTVTRDLPGIPPEEPWPMFDNDSTLYFLNNIYFYS